MRSLLATSLVLATAVVLPASSRPSHAQHMQELRIATLAPRGSELNTNFAKIDTGLKAATNGEWGIKLFPGGVAGDEKDVIRKMRVQQMDASVITSTGLAQIVRDVAVLDTPGVINSYAELDRVKAVMAKEWEAKFDAQDFKLLAWGEAGEYRWFSKAPIQSVTTIKKMRPWLWPESYVAKEIFKTVGAVGVPLGVPEVYGALQTGMVDMVIGTAYATVALQWHIKLTHVSKRTSGVLLAAMVINKKKWESIPEHVKGHVQGEIRRYTEGDADSTRQADRRAYKRLVDRGFVATDFSPAGEKEFQTMSATVRDKLTGRIYDKALLERVLKVAHGG
jgi:TRAP-type C4-dicarboxylate transport system substrate-binding protein